MVKFDGIIKDPLANRSGGVSVKNKRMVGMPDGPSGTLDDEAGRKIDANTRTLGFLMAWKATILAIGNGLRIV